MRSAKSANVNVKPMNLDGTGDIYPFGLDGAPSSYMPQYDDRAWQHIRGGSRYGAPTISSSQLHSGPPPPLSSRPYTAGRPRYTSNAPQASPQLPNYLRGPEGLASNVRYSSDPVQHQTRATSMHGPAPSIQGASAAQISLNPYSLDQALANIAKTRPDRFYQASSQSPTISVGAPNAPPSHIPGSWPEPNRSPASPYVSPVQNLGTGLEFPQPAAALGLQSDLQDMFSSWDQRRPEPSRGDWNEGNGWESGEEGRKSSTWDSGDTWGSPQQDHGRNAFTSERELRQVSGWDAPTPHVSSPVAQTARTGLWTHSSDFHTARSRPSASAWESEIDGEGWTYVEASSDSSGSWSLPVHPSESISHVAGPSVAASVATQAPFVDEFANKLLSLKKDEETQRQSVVTAPAASLAPPMQFPGNGFSTFERSVRAAPVKGQAPSVWKIDRAEVALSWPALEKETIPQSFVNAAFPVDNGFRKVHNNKNWRKPTNDTPANDSTTEKTVGLQVARPSVLHDHNSTSKNVWITEETSWDIPSKPKNLQPSETSWQADINGWSAPQKADSMVDGRNPWAATDEAKIQPSKTRLSKYRQLRLPVPEVAKEYRQLRLPTPDKKHGTRSENANMKTESLLKVTKEDVVKKGVEHQVRAGKGSKYGHAIGRPEYLDSLEKPASAHDSRSLVRPNQVATSLTQTQYAVFRFKYRAHGTLRKILGKDVVPSDAALLATSPIGQLTLGYPNTPLDVSDVKQHLKKVTKDALIDGLLELQTKLATKRNGPDVAPADIAGMNRTRDWVKQQSRATSVHEIKRENRKGGENLSLDDGWD